MRKFDRDLYFDAVREFLFAGSLTQQQVDGQNVILSAWESYVTQTDLRHLAYPLATAFHETAQTMWPIEEYGKGAGYSYGKPDPVTGEIYYGRGFVQLTWADNYARADAELGLTGPQSCYQHADNALDPSIAARIMFQGMKEGWFRTTGSSPNNLAKYFNLDRDDPVGARDIINGDMNSKPSWGDGLTMGQIIANYHADFFAALQVSLVDERPKPKPKPKPKDLIVRVFAPRGVTVIVQEQIDED